MPTFDLPSEGKHASVVEGVVEGHVAVINVITSRGSHRATEVFRMHLRRTIAHLPHIMSQHSQYFATDALQNAAAFS